MSSPTIEEGSQLLLDFEKIKKVAHSGESVVPAIAQDIDTGSVLIIGYANALALETTLKKQIAVFWSTSRNELWIKGANSGDALEIVDVLVNCEQNSLLYQVRLKGKGACHTQDGQGNSRLSCFYRRINPENNSLESL